MNLHVSTASFRRNYHHGGNRIESFQACNPGMFPKKKASSASNGSFLQYKWNIVSRHPKTRHKNLATKRKENLMFSWSTFLHPSNRSIWHHTSYSCSPFGKIWNVSSQSITPTDHGIAIIIEIFTIVYITYIYMSELWPNQLSLFKSPKKNPAKIPPSQLLDSTFAIPKALGPPRFPTHQSWRSDAWLGQAAPWEAIPKSQLQSFFLQCLGCLLAWLGLVGS